MRAFNLLSRMGINTVRFWAFVTYMEDPNDRSRLDFTRHDRLLDIAKARGIRLIPVLVNEWGKGCDREDGHKRSAWWAWKHEHKRHNSWQNKRKGETSMPFPEQVRQYSRHYSNEPGILAIEIANEPFSRHGGPNGQARPRELRRFMEKVSGIIKRYSPQTLVSTGMASPYLPGTDWSSFMKLHRFRHIDLVTAHDYDAQHFGWPGDIDSIRRIGNILKKPFFIGEVGIELIDDDYVRRSDMLRRKLEAAWEHDVDGVLVWSFESSPDGSDKNDIGYGDPALEMIRKFARRHGIKPHP